MTKEDRAWISITLVADRGRIEEDLKRYAHSLTFQPGKEEPVKVPPDVRAFLDMYCADLVSHDVGAIMAHFSDQFLHSGTKKAFYEQVFRIHPDTLPGRGVTAFEATVTVFEAHGDKAYVDGFFLEKVKGDANAQKMTMFFQQIIKEHGQWKWYGNHK